MGERSLIAHCSSGMFTLRWRLWRFIDKISPSVHFVVMTMPPNAYSLSSHHRLSLLSSSSSSLSSSIIIVIVINPLTLSIPRDDLRTTVSSLYQSVRRRPIDNVAVRKIWREDVPWTMDNGRHPASGRHQYQYYPLSHHP